MYYICLSFESSVAHNEEKISALINSYLHSLRMNGQVLGREFSMIKKQNIFSSYVFIPEKISLNNCFSNVYVCKCYEELKKAHIKITKTIIGKDIDSASLCKCAFQNTYILYSNYLTLESPLRCGNCFGVIPLYKIPKTYNNEDYYDIKSWESDYQCCDTLQMGCSVGEKFATKQMSEYNSVLSKYGIMVCKKIANLTGKNVYYYLYRYVSTSSKHKEVNRKCPSCGGEWFLEKRIHNLFDFKCDTCFLLSNTSWSLS